MALLCLAALGAGAQEKNSAQPQLRLNVVNVCTPGDAARKEIATALARIPVQAALSSDFEVARGRTTTADHPASTWVRLRRDMNAGGITNVQYLFSIAGSTIEESIVFHWRGSKAGEPLQLSLTNQVTAGTPEAVLSSDTPPGRLRMERFGETSLILTRCADADQRSYEPLFREAAERFARYRAALGVRSTVKAELARLQPAAPRHSGSR